MFEPLRREKDKKIKEQGIEDLNIIALKSSKSHLEDSSEEESEDEEMTYLFKIFTRFMKSEMEKSKHELKKKR
ncbi:hypothetical protein GQ457_11G023580 [Hibiscus cannabinus]